MIHPSSSPSTSSQLNRYASHLCERFNRFCGNVPKKFKNLKILIELDISNNQFASKFPCVVLQLTQLKFLDMRFNGFESEVSSELFDKDLDAIFINHNSFPLSIATEVAAAAATFNAATLAVIGGGSVAALASVLSLYDPEKRFQQWRKIYGETVEVNRVQMDIRIGHSKIVENVMQMLTDKGPLEGVTYITPQAW
ncbi:hypothetical protein RJ639_043211 [Escallonia herrerae]|uniref:Uncharacterized protein n=1 Tax=Escallonia herrerae TaxID=1293975 RepID=A0AA89B441_9ASTE|nr:hypothetical protein RJ639_043211 [Escallonia herrerae]